MLSSGVFGAADAHARPQAASSPKACAKRPSSANLAAAFEPARDTARLAVSPSESAVAGPSDTTSPAPSSAPAPTESTTASPTSDPSASSTDTSTSTPSGTTSPTASPSSPSPSPTSTSPSPSPDPRPSSKKPAPKPQLCVQVQSLSGSSQVQVGKPAGFVVWVWSAGGASQNVAVAASVAKAPDIASPKYTVCLQPGKSTCDLGTLATGQVYELQATSAVSKAAASGEKVRLTAKATGTNALSGTASGTLSVTAGTPAPGNPPPAFSQQVFSVPIQPGALQPLPGLPGGAGSADGLFPTVAPSPGAGIGFPPARKHGTAARIVTDSATVPLSSRLIGGQLAGLAVLAGGVMIAIARLSLRKPKADGPDGSA